MMRARVAVAAIWLWAVPLAAQQVLPWHRLDLDSLTKATAADSDDAVVQYRNARAFWDRKKYDEADSLLRRAIALAPQYADPRLALGFLPAIRGEGYYERIAHRVGADSMRILMRPYAEATRRAFLLDPGVDLGIMVHAEDKVLQPEPVSAVISGPRTIRFYDNGWWYDPLRKGVKQLIEGAADTAFATLDQALHAKELQEGRQLPGEFVWWYCVAAFHVRRYDRAAAALRTLVSRATTNETSHQGWAPSQTRADFQYLLATAFFLGGALESADTAFRAALDLDLGLYMAHVQLARIAEAEGDWAGATVERQRAIDANPEEGGLYLDLGGTLLHAGHPEAAESAFVAGTRLAPSDPRGWYLLGVTAQGMDHVDVVRAALDHFLVIASSRFGEQITDAKARLTHLPPATP